MSEKRREWTAEEVHKAYSDEYLQTAEEVAGAEGLKFRLMPEEEVQFKEVCEDVANYSGDVHLSKRGVLTLVDFQLWLLWS